MSLNDMAFLQCGRIRSWCRAGLMAGLLVLSSAALADLEAGLQAYRKGEFSQALREFLSLARAGDASAQYNLGQMYRQGQGVRVDQAAAVRWYRAAAERGLTRAQFNLAVMYEKGMGVETSLVHAAEWFERAAAGGHGGAAKALSEMRDLRSEAGASLRRQRVDLLLAANRDDAEAQYQLGLAYALAVGGERDLSLAANWLRKAAEQGVAGAQVQLGVMYANGQGVGLDLVEAYAWLQIASRAGDARGRQNLDALQSRLSPTQRKQGQARSVLLLAAMDRRASSGTSDR